MADETQNLLCLVCGEPSYLPKEVRADKCPQCGDPGIPADLDQTDTITLTQYELRILTFWAKAYARIFAQGGYDPDRRMENTLKTIFDRISMQTDTPLSLVQDLANLRYEMTEKLGHNVDVVLMDGHGKCIECNEPLNTLDEDEMLSHRCGEESLPTDDTPPSA